ncbi:DegT/DnrJ/EryC1/StrS aminotransferase family protein [Candidatus Woesearchaeota archaeon]|jgi:dTDP-4-amino-4,6-dideoxygalactose transaminase|nr:DegT/DnrJ/EryC1/StrS aminotransferase family protein [Candidatus Woesearchaeota archaeon]
MQYLTSNSHLLELLCFELNLSKFDYNVIPVSRASLGLQVILQILRNNKQQYLVALPAIVCQDVIIAVISSGCKPFFCDVNVKDGLVPDREWIRARDAGVNVAIVVHIYGNIADTVGIMNIFNSKQCTVIEDAAQAFGSSLNGNLAGYAGDISLLSFGKTKHIDAGGSGVLLIKNDTLYKKARNYIESIVAVNRSQRLSEMGRFRLGYKNAKKQLINEGKKDGFIGLLKNYEVVLYSKLNWNHIRKANYLLQVYGDTKKDRIKKSLLWGNFLNNIGFIPVGMGAEIVPWRYTCRLPNISIIEQYEFGEKIRGMGVNVSHHYIPANLFFHETQDNYLPGAKKLSREIFQFWVDQNTSIDDIKYGANVVKELIHKYEK